MASLDSTITCINCKREISDNEVSPSMRRAIEAGEMGFTIMVGGVGQSCVENLIYCSLACEVDYALKTEWIQFLNTPKVNNDT